LGRNRATLTLIALSESPRRSSHQAQNQQQYDCSYCGVHDFGCPANANMNAQSWQYPIANEGTENSDNNVTYESKAAASHDLPCQPSCNKSDQQDHKQALVRDVHGEAPNPVALFGLCFKSFIGVITIRKP
jgi:hypothetical protein